MGIKSEKFGHINGVDVHLYTLTNSNGITVRITNYGGIITSIQTPDRNGRMTNIALGFDTLDKYLAGHPYFGCIVGRYANRIAKGKFTLNGRQYSLFINNGNNTLHGGEKGFDKVVWHASAIETAEGQALHLSYLSSDMEEGYPGNLTVDVEYMLTAKNELKIYYTATTDQPTHINLTNHTYFNFTGCRRDILGHELQIFANDYTPSDEDLIPTGEIRPLQGTPLNFTVFKPIGKDINNVKGGYDHNYVLANPDGQLITAAKVFDSESGRWMEVLTTEPGIQLYTGNFLDGTTDAMHKKHYGFCLETQHYPDSPNKPQFPSTLLHPGETYNQLTIYKFGVV